MAKGKVAGKMAGSSTPASNINAMAPSVQSAAQQQLQSYKDIRNFDFGLDAAAHKKLAEQRIKELETQNQGAVALAQAGQTRFQDPELYSAQRDAELRKLRDSGRASESDGGGAMAGQSILGMMNAHEARKADRARERANNAANRGRDLINAHINAEATREATKSQREIAERSALQSGFAGSALMELGRSSNDLAIARINQATQMHQANLSQYSDLYRSNMGSIRHS